MSGIKIKGTGSYLPSKIIRNEDFTKIVETSDEWIKTRTGMSERHISEGQPTWYMGTRAVEEAIKNAGIDVSDIGIIICATVTGDFITPSTACIIQREIGAFGSMAFDISCACAGFVYAFDMARRYLMTDESIKYAVVVANENLTKITDYSDRSTCVLFGDGAAACVIELSKDSLYTSYLGADGSGAKYVSARSFPPDNAFMPENREQYPDDMQEGNSHYLYQNGKEVYKFAIKAFPNAVKSAAEKIGLNIEDIDLIIPHQANYRIIETAVQNMNLPIEKFYVNIEKYGNTSSASIPLAFDEAVRNGTVKRGDKVCFVGFGAGLTYGAAIFEY